MRGKGLPAYVALVLLLGISAAGYAAEPIKLKFANYFPVIHKNTALGQLFCDEIKKRTGGRVEISYYPGGTSSPPPRCLPASARGSRISASRTAAIQGAASPSWS